MSASIPPAATSSQDRQKPAIRTGSAIAATVALAAVALVLLPLFLSDQPWPSAARDHLEHRGEAETGAPNLVSAIYLGYRAFDTLGETIVLLIAVSGTIRIAARAGGGLAHGFGTETRAEGGPAPDSPRQSRLLRTHLVEAVTSKLGPIVLLFGIYVMLYGHLSPGGGFQGGVVIASGIVFLALGNRRGAYTRITRAGVLARIEAAAFLLLMAASLSGMFFGSGNGAAAGYFSNPLVAFNQLPAGFIILLNGIIGMKVGAGIGFMCIAMLGKGEYS